MFLRELAQNALDAHVEAGVSRPVEFWTEFNPYEKGGKGIFTLHLEDKSVGMNLQDINSSLTCLFSSPKKDDNRLIGTFGIGFVSVFAWQPNAIIVDTGKGDEAWRLIFKQNRKFDRIPLNRPTAGTHVRVVKEVQAKEVPRIRKRMKETLKHWCRMANLDIRFDDENICEEFRYSGELRFRLDSKEIQHGLTRDWATKDETFGCLMKAVREFVHGPYFDHLLEQAESEPSDQLWYNLSFQLEHLHGRHLKVPIIPACNGTKLSLRQIRKQVTQNQLFWTPNENPNLNVVLWDGEAPGLHRLLRNLNQITRSIVGRLTRRLYPPTEIVLIQA